MSPRRRERCGDMLWLAAACAGGTASDGFRVVRARPLGPCDAIERVAFVADNPGKWLLEGRALKRPDTETAAWFVVD